LKVSILVGTLALVLVAGLGTPAFGVDEGFPHIENAPIVAQTELSSPNDADPDEVVYENGVPAAINGNFVHINSVAQDFVLDDPASITDVHLILIEFQGTAFDGEIQYNIFGDNNGPDINNELGTGTATIVETEQLVDGPQGPRLIVWFDLEDPVGPLDAGVTYWLLIHAGTGFSTPPNYLWEHTTEPVGECTRFYPGGNLNNPSLNCSQDTWFQITSHKAAVVGGEFIPIETTSLLLAAASNPASWLTSLTIAALGIGVYVFTRNPNNMRNIKVILRDYLDRL